MRGGQPQSALLCACALTVYVIPENTMASASLGPNCDSVPLAPPGGKPCIFRNCFLVIDRKAGSGSKVGDVSGARVIWWPRTRRETQIACGT